MNARFHAPDAEKAGDRVVLPDEEAQHLTRVLRLKTGAAIRVFNGRGREFEAVVGTAGKRGVQILIGHAREPGAREPRVAVTLAQAVLKGDKMDEVVRDAVMMGVAAVQPIVAARSEVTLSSLLRGRRQERWGRIAVSSAKQSGRATVPPVLEPRSFDALLAALSAMTGSPPRVRGGVQVTLPGPGLMFVEPSASAGAMTLGDLDASPPREATLMIGPEGGWETSEVERASAACRLVTLGGRTLRADAMPLVALTALFALWKEF